VKNTPIDPSERLVGVFFIGLMIGGLRMIFDRAYSIFLEKHLDESSGLRKERLLRGLGFGEHLFLKDGWWPAIGSFDYLHPEFMVRDFREGYRFLDFAYLRPPHMLDIEVDGFTPHNMDRRQFSDERDRQNFLVMDGWKVFRFSVDKLKERPRESQMQLQQILGILYNEKGILDSLLSPQELILIEHAGRYGDTFTPSQVAEWLGVSVRQARTHLYNLVGKGHIAPSSGTKRIRTYTLSRKPLGE